jgi:ankyrin repeat protein
MHDQGALETLALANLLSSSDQCLGKRQSFGSYSSFFFRRGKNNLKHFSEQAIEVLLQQEVNINTFGANGMTPLMLAASNGYTIYFIIKFAIKCTHTLIYVHFNATFQYKFRHKILEILYLIVQ